MRNSASVAVGRLLWADRGRAVLPSRNQSGVVAFKGGEFGGEELAFGDKDDVQTRPGLVTPIELSRKALRPIANDRAAEPTCGRDAEPTRRQARAKQEHRHEPAPELQALLIDTLEIGAASDSLAGTEAQPQPDRSLLGDALHVAGQETVNLFRPLARRRFRTSRPFLVLIRSRKPCVLRRRLRFGWKVRFIDLAPIKAVCARPQNLSWYPCRSRVSTHAVCRPRSGYVTTTRAHEFAARRTRPQLTSHTTSK
jgi:hypothetical protein